jgi:hypothetical protein
MLGFAMRSAFPSNSRAFAMAYVLARQETGCKRSAAKTNTPLNALFCGVFRLYLLTSPTKQMSYLRSERPFLSKPPDFANLVRIFQVIVFA